MPIANALINVLTLNVSAQVGDIIYYTDTSLIGGINQGEISDTTMLGPIVSITPVDDGTVNVVFQFDNAYSLPEKEDFLSFAKDKKINTTSLLGYYASVNFKNNSTGKIELFSIGSEVSESSK